MSTENLDEYSKFRWVAEKKNLDELQKKKIK